MIVEVLGSTTSGKRVAFNKLKYLQSLYAYNLSLKSITFENFSVDIIFREETDLSDCLLVNEEFLVLLVGRISHRNFVSKKHNSILNDVFDQYLAGCSIKTQFKGDFNLIIWNKKKEILTIISDHFNLCPIYYAQIGTQLVFSSDLKLITLHDKSFQNPCNQSVTELTFFNVLFDDHTLYKNVRCTRSADILKFVKGELDIYRDWKPEIFIQSEYDSFDLPDLIDTFGNNILNEHPGHFILPLTGGYDSRTILSYLKSESLDCSAFSYGNRSSPDIQIPLQLAKQLGLAYNPIFLDTKEFKEFVIDHGSEVSEKTNGLGTHLNSNNLFALTKLKTTNSIYISGILGSEIFKPLVRSEAIYLDLYKNVFLKNDYTFEDFIFYCSKNIKNNINESEKNHLFSVYQHLKFKNRFNGIENSTVRLFMFLLLEVYKNYYMKEIYLIKKFSNVYLPYMDVDFLEMVFQSKFSDLRRKFESSISRKNHLFYVKSMRKKAPDLLRFRTNLGVLPRFEDSVLLQPISILSRFNRKINNFRKQSSIVDYQTLLEDSNYKSKHLDKSELLSFNYRMRKYSLQRYLDLQISE